MLEQALKGLNRFREVECMWIKNARMASLTEDQRFISYFRIFTFEAYWKVTQITIEEVYEEITALQVSEEFKKGASFAQSLARMGSMAIEKMKNLSFKLSVNEAWQHQVQVFCRVYKEMFDKTKVALDSPLMMPPNSMYFTKYVNLQVLRNELSTESALYSELNQIAGSEDLESIKQSTTHNYHDLAVYLLLIKSICEWTCTDEFDSTTLSSLDGLCTDTVSSELRNEVKYQPVVYNLFKVIFLLEKETLTLVEQSLLVQLLPSSLDYLKQLAAGGPSNRQLRRKILYRQIQNLSARKPKNMSLVDYVQEFDALVQEYSEFTDDTQALASEKYQVYVQANRYEEASQQLSKMSEMHDEGKAKGILTLDEVYSEQAWLGYS
jgi:hypothetical protein